MEEKYRQAETDRASEQTTREQQLEHKRKQIEDMQLDATKIKQEAQQVAHLNGLLCISSQLYENKINYCQSYLKPIFVN